MLAKKMVTVKELNVNMGQLINTKIQLAIKERELTDRLDFTVNPLCMTVIIIYQKPLKFK